MCVEGIRGGFTEKFHRILKDRWEHRWIVHCLEIFWWVVVFCPKKRYWIIDFISRLSSHFKKSLPWFRFDFLQWKMRWRNEIGGWTTKKHWPIGQRRTKSILNRFLWPIWFTNLLMDVDRANEVLEYSCPLAANLNEEIFQLSLFFMSGKILQSYTRKFARWLIISKVVQIWERGKKFSPVSCLCVCELLHQSDVYSCLDRNMK